jgi:hypothetical protein
VPRGSAARRVLTRFTPQDGTKYYEIAIVRALPGAVGGGRFAVVNVITDSKRESVFIQTLWTLRTVCLLNFGARSHAACPRLASAADAPARA